MQRTHPPAYRQAPLTRGDLLVRLSHRLRRLQRHVGVRPRTFCLITGPPRSGTTAVSNWLGAQPGVTALSESRILIAAHRFLQEVQRLRHLQASAAELEKRIARLVFGYYSDRHWLLGPSILVDKEPLGHVALSDGSHSEFLENVARIRPDCRFLLMIRHPIPTIWSMQQRTWGHSLARGSPTSNSLDEDIDHWRRAAAAVARQVRQPNVLLCHFERLVEHPGEESDRILRFLGASGGVPFEPRPTKEVRFRDRERHRIGRATADEVSSLGLRSSVGSIAV